MPADPLTSRLGNRLGRTRGSFRVSSKLGSQFTVSWKVSPPYTGTQQAGRRPQSRNCRGHLPAYTAWKSPVPGAPGRRRPIDLRGDGTGPRRRPHRWQTSGRAGLRSGCLHFPNQLGGHNGLVGKQNVFRFVILLMLCQAATSLVVQICHIAGILFNVFLPGLHLFPHEEGKNLIGPDGVLQFNSF